MFKYDLNFNSEDDLKESIHALATKIARNAVLKLNDNQYRIIDFEFYFHSKEEFGKDPQTHNNALQHEKAKFYDHASGLDLTFGDQQNAVGILIRGVAKLAQLQDEKLEDYPIAAYIDSPHKARTELIGNLHFNQLNNIEFIETATDIASLFPEQPIKLITSKRVNLTAKSTDEIDKYLNAPLRYILLTPRYMLNEKHILVFNGNPIKIAGIENLVKDAMNDPAIHLSSQEAELFVGYKFNK